MKTKLIICACLLFICGFASGQTADSVKFISLPPRDFQQTYNNAAKSLLVDVREFFEYRKSRIKNAVNIPSSGNLEYSADTIKKDVSLFLYCTSGFRSKRVAKYFSGKGFTKVYSLEGGINAWKKEGLDVEKKRIRKRD